MKLRSFRNFPATRLALSLPLLALFLAVPPAFAHAHPVDMMPKANSTVAAPANILVHFSEEMEPKLSKMTLVDAAGKTVSKQPSVVGDAKTMTLPLPSLTPGVYTVKWVTVAADDGHRLEGNYKFTVK
ncbi:MAG TPA: copper resistance protein CopC [Bryobacteraceae bacterium]|jgi:methionine-rich copper-binding protein CopC|nr:copper resistance protein CopC [Bryobacteraceae bacterium]